MSRGNGYGSGDEREPTTAKVDERLEPGLVEFAHAAWNSLPEEVLRMEGMMADKVTPERGADAQTKLLNFLGRTV